MRHATLLKLGLLAGILGGVYYLGSNQENEKAEPAATEVAAKTRRPVEADISEHLIVPKRSPGVVAKIGDLAARSFRFYEKGDGYAAEGVTVSKEGEVSVKSRYTDGTIRAQLQSAFIGTEEKSLPRNVDIESKTELKSDEGRVMLSSFFDGVDVEYRYDGKDVEEFFHLSDDLKKQVAAGDEDFIIRSVIPGVFRRNGDEIMSQYAGTPLHAGGVPGVIGEASEFGATKVMGGVTLSTVEGDRFGLPAAIAYDDASHSKELARTFEWTDEGLRVDVHLPAQWVREKAKGKVIIDPSIVDSNRAIRITTWNETNMVKDSGGRLHVAYSSVYAGRWSIVRSAGNSQTGEWDAPQVVQGTFASGENQYYAPSLAIDSNDTLHVTWGDHGNIPSLPTEKGPYTSWGHRVRYASCTNRCDSGNSWSPSDSVSQLIAPTNYRHQARYHIAVAGSGNGATANDAHVAFLEWDHSYDTSMPYEVTRHFRFRNGTKTELSQIPISVSGSGSNRNRYATHLAWGADNALWAVMAQYEWDRDIKTYSWNGSNDSWTAGPTTKLWHPRNSGQNMHQYRLNCSAGGSSNLLHCGWNVYYWNGDNVWGIGYGALNTVSRSWQQTQHVDANPAAVSGAGGSQYHHQFPAISTQNDNVYMFWSRNPRVSGSGTTNVRGAFKTSGSSSFSPAFTLTGPGFNANRVRALPRLFYPSSMANHAGTAWEILVEVDGTELRHLAPFTVKYPSSPPNLRFPMDGNFVTSNSTNLFSWTSVLEDGGDSNNPVTYTLQVATEASFSNVVLTRTFSGTGQQTSETFGSWNPPENCYYWRVRVSSNLLGTGDWSRVRHFCVDNTAPNTFSPLTPANGVDPQSNTPRFTWNPAVDPE